MKNTSRFLILLSAVVAAGVGGWFAWESGTPTPPVEAPVSNITKSVRSAAPVAPPRQRESSPSHSRVEGVSGLASSPLPPVPVPVPPPAPQNEGVKTFVEDSQWDAGSLLGAYRSTGDVAWLNEARARYPTNPSVLTEIALRGKTDAEKNIAIAQLQTLEPDNVLPLHLGASQAIAQGNDEDALRQLAAASRLMFKGGEFDDHSTDFRDQTYAAYLAAGYSQQQALIRQRLNARQNLAPHYERLGRKINEWTRDHAAQGNRIQADAFRDLGQRTFEWPSVVQRFITLPADRPLMVSFSESKVTTLAGFSRVGETTGAPRPETYVYSRTRFSIEGDRVRYVANPAVSTTVTRPTTSETHGVGSVTSHMAKMPRIDPGSLRLNQSN